MRLFAQIYYLLIKRMNYQRFNTPDKFDTLYQLDEDPFNVSTSNYEQHKFNDILSVLEERTFERTLDLGCGPGYLTERFASYSGTITAVDFSEKAIELAKKNCSHCTNVEFVKEDITKFKRQERYDLFFCSEVLYYLDEEGFDRLVANIHEMASPNAELVVTCRLDDEVMRERLEKHFTLKRSKPSPKWLRPYVIYLFEINPIVN
jgi:2-polyprenyl-3-methyl-5-hydroxy-6-metoxy-1,4-benzoquinol methylase